MQIGNSEYFWFPAIRNCIQQFSTVSTSGVPEHRPLCIPTLLPNRSVRELVSRPSRNSHGFVYSRLNNFSGPRLPPVCFDRPMPPPNSESADVTHGVCTTSFTCPTLVSSAVKTVTSPTATSSGRLSNTGIQNPPPQTLTTVWMASVSRGYQTADISEESRNILFAAWRKNTTSAYSSEWAKWSSWCSQRVNVIPLISPSLTNVLNFLALQFRDGKEYRTVNAYGSAVSAVLFLIDGHKVGSHPLVSG